MLAPARLSHSKMGRPPAITNMVPGRDRLNYKHKIFWTHRSRKSAEQYNAIAEVYSKPCLRRWLEYVGGRVPKTLSYRTIYSPPSITPRPARYWILVRDNEEVSCFTNCTEAWLVCIGQNIFNTKHKWSLFYVDRTI
jgi:hypothetical protein